MPLDVSLFCLKLERVRFDRIRLVVFCAPPHGGPLASALSLFGAKKKSASSAVIRQPNLILAAAKELGMDAETLAALEGYAKAWQGGRRGRQVQNYVQEARLAAVAAIPGLSAIEE